MGRRRSKNGPEDAVFGLLMLGLLYLVATHRWAQLLKAVLVVAALVALAIVVIKLIRRRPQQDARQTSRVVRLQPRLGEVAPVGANPDRAPNFIDQLQDYRATEPPDKVDSKPAEWSLALIRELEWKRFEELCEGFWKAKGYRAEPTGRGADGGVDVNLYRPSDPDRLLAIIQCKSRSREPIGVSYVRELYGVMHHVQAPMGILVVSTGFHTPAREFAVGKHLQLIDGESLLKQLQELPSEASHRLREHVTRDDYVTPTCPSCDRKMVKRTNKGKGNDFFGCHNFPRCRQTFQLR